MSERSFMEMVKTMSEEERETMGDFVFFDMWGITQAEFSKLAPAEKQALAKKRKISAAGADWSNIPSDNDNT